MSAEVAAVLVDAKTMIDTPEKWVKGVYRTHDRGRICYCAVGAVTAATDYKLSSTPRLRLGAFRALAAAMLRPSKKYENDPHSRVVAYNDNRNVRHSGVMALFDRAIAAEQAQS